ncbi:MAG: MoaD/ThiS family protein [Anaerolineaceae bacterium]|nr:MoaD/ThiS family protein [Anaerolineaceae bacterium]
MHSGQITVKVRFFGILEKYAGARLIVFDVPEGYTLQELLDKLEEINPPAYRELFRQIPESEPFLRIMINDVLIHKNDEIPLTQNDVITLLPGISGG